MTLANLAINGQDRRVIMQANKNGFFYVLDRETGEFISAKPFAELNWASGIDPRTGRPIVNPEARYGTQTVCIIPGATGAHNWWPMSFSANTGLMYIPMTDWGPEALSVQKDFVYDEKRLNIGVSAEAGSCGSGRATRSLTPPAIGPVRTAPEGTDLASWLIAWDPVLQREGWSAFGHGGTLATAGNLVFQVGGTFRAYNAGTGEKLFDEAIPTTRPEYMSPPITFMLDRRQYVVFASYITPTTTGVPSPGRTRPPDVSRIYAFVLDGIAPTP